MVVRPGRGIGLVIVLETNSFNDDGSAGMPSRHHYKADRVKSLVIWV
ncbi:MAG: hypothetical protein CM1200mP27_11840 [Chloroflexota bacterium]|nr:MAG: hypothetical protein CM1200mP27_11840 [Chloroflexota bacterium]